APPGPGRHGARQAGRSPELRIRVAVEGAPRAPQHVPGRRAARPGVRARPFRSRAGPPRAVPVRPPPRVRSPPPLSTPARLLRRAAALHPAAPEAGPATRIPAPADGAGPHTMP